MFPKVHMDSTVHHVLYFRHLLKQSNEAKRKIDAGSAVPRVWEVFDVANDGCILRWQVSNSLGDMGNMGVFHTPQE